MATVMAMATVTVMPTHPRFARSWFMFRGCEVEFDADGGAQGMRAPCRRFVWR